MDSEIDLAVSRAEYDLIRSALNALKMEFHEMTGNAALLEDWTTAKFLRSREELIYVLEDKLSEQSGITEFERLPNEQ